MSDYSGYNDDQREVVKHIVAHLESNRAKDKEYAQLVRDNAPHRKNLNDTKTIDSLINDLKGGDGEFFEQTYDCIEVFVRLSGLT